MRSRLVLFLMYWLLQSCHSHPVFAGQQKAPPSPLEQNLLRTHPVTVNSYAWLQSRGLWSPVHLMLLGPRDFAQSLDVGIYEMGSIKK
jgi:hypothetical protein